jgi:DNA invertase Pin-like site-specific DNA recombinase
LCRIRGQRSERKTDDADHAEYVKRLVEAQGKRAGADLPMFALFAEAVDFARARLQDAADELIAQGRSYTDIARELGITRQAAWKRFGRKPKVGARTAGTGGAG